jgi:hypothetical protein
MTKLELIKILDDTPDHAIIGFRFDTFDGDVISFAPFEKAQLHETSDRERAILILIAGDSVKLPLVALQ